MISRDSNIITQQIYSALSVKDRAIVLIFSADWISQSTIVEIVAEKIKNSDKNVDVIQIDVERNEDLAIKYRISNVPTAIIIRNNQFLKKVEGIFSKKEILDHIPDSNVS